ncbi:hypothetical protein B0H21DRAFT_507562 [Amylocystis lapponica]|nr:hypothetical protein B0H21DRAFT_507562 [Amylocystis lapponica]
MWMSWMRNHSQAPLYIALTSSFVFSWGEQLLSEDSSVPEDVPHRIRQPRGVHSGRPMLYIHLAAQLDPPKSPCCRFSRHDLEQWPVAGFCVEIRLTQCSQREDEAQSIRMTEIH